MIWSYSPGRPHLTIASAEQGTFKRLATVRWRHRRRVLRHLSPNIALSPNASSSPVLWMTSEKLVIHCNQPVAFHILSRLCHAVPTFDFGEDLIHQTGLQLSNMTQTLPSNSCDPFWSVFYRSRPCPGPWSLKLLVLHRLVTLARDCPAPKRGLQKEWTRMKKQISYRFLFSLSFFLRPLHHVQ